MLALGGFLTSMALLTLATCAIIFRRPDAPRWATRGWVHEVATIVFASLLVIGLGYLVAGGASAYREGPHLIDLGLLAGVLVVSIMIWRMLDVRARLRAFEAVADVREPTVISIGSANPMPAQQGMPTARNDPPAPTPTDRAA